MNELLRLIGRYGGTIEWRTDDLPLGDCALCPEHPPAPAVAEITSVDVVANLTCAEHLEDALDRAYRAAEDAGDRDPRITVTVLRDPTGGRRAA